MMMPEVEFLDYRINIFHVVKFVSKNAKSCKHDIHDMFTSRWTSMYSEQQNKTIKHVLF